jgi:hypothetical protein
MSQISGIAAKQANMALQPAGDWTPALTDDFLDATTFEQLLEMDDDEQREFSKGIVWNYFEQVKESFAKIEDGMYLHLKYQVTL